MLKIIPLILLCSCSTAVVSKDLATNCKPKGSVVALLSNSGYHAGTGYTAMINKLTIEAKAVGADSIVLDDKINTNSIILAKAYKCKDI